MFKKFTLLSVLLAVGGLSAANILIDYQPVSQPAPTTPVAAASPVVMHHAPILLSPIVPITSANPVISQPKPSAITKPPTIYPEQILSEDVFAVDGQQYKMRKYKALLVPDDPSAMQWWVAQTGLPASWDNSIGANTKIAIIDTGFALQHEEFSQRWLDNEAEAGPPNGIDDDSNGFIDDFRGWDFNSNDSSVQAGEVNPAGSGVSHGTAVTGVAAASGNNGVGIAGVSWGAKILPLQALSDNGSGNTLGIARAIRYAVDRDVDVINLSLGSDQEDSYLRQAIQYAMERGVIVVAASGNDGCNCMSYPARYPEVVAVGASRSDGSTASFSSYGDTLDIIAPGSGIRTPVWNSAAPTNSYGQGFAGTSFASPYISGLLANARAKQPNASWSQLVNGLTQTADHRTLTAVAPRSNTLGFGYVKADGFMNRLSLPFTQTLRYSFLNSRDNNGDDAQECEPGQLPTAPFYEITQAGSVRYSTSDLTALLQRRSGATVTQKGYTCTGLPTDVVTHLRSIDPVREFSNSTNKQ